MSRAPVLGIVNEIAPGVFVFCFFNNQTMPVMMLR